MEKKCWKDFSCSVVNFFEIVNPFIILMEGFYFTVSSYMNNMYFFTENFAYITI
ncbi:hypothetical protein BCF50_1913 [Chryseobacterium daecheongense]|uniref:Uncharacterized protein n=1 Tax=Chryseobacterium daecheongense TaxID=192389 RepID=A0ABY2FVG5_9FLAO|nr:hypothetical protein BCF50_1913 [Chryseobacterium daecheongense]